VKQAPGTSTPAHTVDVVTMGESMVLFQPLRDGPLAHEPLLTRGVGGAESNVAIALSRLGRKTRWVSRLGRDPFGDIIQSTLAGEGVDVSFVARDESASTGVFFKEIKPLSDPSVYYFRRGSAASRLSPEDVRPDWMRGARHLHVTGITPALSPSAREATLAAMRLARELGLSVSFDPNLRRKLWDEDTARDTLLEMVPLCDIFLPGIDEANFLCGEGSAPTCAKYFLECGPSLVVFKNGEHGSTAFACDHEVSALAHCVPRVIDSVGAGDAFAAGFLSVLLQHHALANASPQVLERALTRANLLGALATQFRGDWEGLPRLEEVRRLEAGQSEVSR
jgi:2-dehydro-3-deoxygluconokinase